MRLIAIVATMLGCVCLADRPAAAPPSWVEVKSPHFTVYTDASEKAGRNVAWQLEQIRTALQHGWPWLGDQLDRPIVVYGPKDEKSMRALVPQYWEKNGGFHPVSVFATAADSYFLVLETDVKTDGPQGVNPYRQAYWSYGALALESSGNRGMPFWFTSGFREVISNTNVIDTEVQFGRAIPDHFNRLQGAWHYTLDQLFKVTSESPDYRIEDKRLDYDAECWALMQYLLFGGVDISNRDANANHLASELLKGRPSADVIAEVFGSVAKLESAVHAFVSQGVSHYMSVKVDAAIDAKAFTARPVAAAEEMALRATLHAAMNRPVEARAAIAEAKKADPPAPGTADIEGRLLEREKKPDEARTAFEQAVTAGSTNFYSYYRLAGLMWTSTATPADFDKMEELLMRSTTLNDAYEPSQTLLANVRLRLRKAGGALASATRAMELRPDRPSPRLAVAEAHFQLGDKEGALKMALSAMSASRTDDEKQRAQQAIDRYSK